MKANSGGNKDELVNLSHNVILSNMKLMFRSMKHEFKREIHDLKDDIDFRLSSLEDFMSEKVKNAIRDEMCTIHQHMNTEVARLSSSMSRLDRITTSVDVTLERHQNRVIKYLPYKENEILKDKCKDLQCEEVGVGDVEVDKAVRKPGVLFATCESKGDKDKVWKGKSKLKDKIALTNVYM